MQDDRPASGSAHVVSFADFTAARARRQAEQLTLFDPPAQPADLWPRATRPVTARGIEHRQRMLRHLTTARG